MRATKSRRLPVPMEEAYRYIDDPGEWPQWYSGVVEITDADPRWEQPGDTVHFRYRALGRTIDSEVRLEVHDDAQTRFRGDLGGMLASHWDWRYEGDGDRCTLTVTMETEEPTSFLGKAIDRLLLPRMLERDLERTLDDLEQIFAQGLHRT
jgi:carbon monoxide dehydrogenase subunit G